MDNSSKRLVEVFFYGLYMDEALLKDKGVCIRGYKKAHVEGYSLRLGDFATLLRKKYAQASGLVYALTHEEIELLYGSLDVTYVSESLLATLEDGTSMPVLSFTLLEPPKESEHNEEYFNKLIPCLEKYGLPKPKDIGFV